MMKQKRRAKVQWKKIVQEFNESKLKPEEFSKEHHLCSRSLLRWKKRFNKEEKNELSNHFIKLKPIKPEVKNIAQSFPFCLKVGQIELQMQELPAVSWLNELFKIIGHVKQDHRMNRNYLKGIKGNSINALLAASGFNMRKLLKAFFFYFWFVFGSQKNYSLT